MPSALDWCEPPAVLPLAADEIHVWRAALDLDPVTYDRLETSLSPDEKARAARFLFEVDRKHFVAARGILRDLLGRYLFQPPSTLAFSYGPQGKPALETKSYRGQPPLCFNLSHSQGLALYAFTYGREVGIDVEAIRPTFSTEEIAERFFSPQEVADFIALPDARRAEGFFLCWTRKEAYIKARSEGLQIPLDSFSVSLTPGQPELLQSADSPRWTVRSLQPMPGFAAAIIAEGRDWTPRSWSWAPRARE